MQDKAPTVVEQAARQLVERHGHNAIDIIRACGDFADSLGDAVASKEWRDIADAAERIAGEPSGGADEPVA